jgi:uncharacterized protein YjbI with pentapeptide repeats
MDQLTGKSLVRELSISKADLVLACLNLGISVFGVDVLQREFSQDEILGIQKRVEKGDQSESAKSGKPKKKRKIKQTVHKTPRYFADEFQVDIGEVFALSKSFGFVLRNENRRLTDRQIAVLEEQLIAREDPAIVELQNESVEISGNSVFALALKRALESRESSVVAESRKLSTEVAFVATSKRLKLIANERGISEVLLKTLCAAVGIPVVAGKKSSKIEVQYLDQLENTIAALNEVQQHKSSEEKVRISKIAKTFSVQAKDVRELCEANGISVISERFIANDSETIVLVLLQLKSDSGGEDVQTNLPHVLEKPTSIKTKAVDYSGLSLTRQDVHDYDFSNSMMQEVDFSYSKLSALSFNHSQLQKSLFVQVNVKNSMFGSANLDGAVFDFVVADKINFQNANLTSASFRKAKLKNCIFSGADLSQCNFQDAELENCDFSGAVIADTKWINGKLVQSCEDLARYGTK